MSRRTRRPQRSTRADDDGDNSPTADQVSWFKAVFDLFAGNKNYMEKDDLKTALKQFNMRTNETMIEQMFKEADVTNSGKVQFSEFMSMMNSRMNKTDSEDQVLAAFRVFDTSDGAGQIDLPVLAHALTTLGDPLSENELNEMLQVCEKDGIVYYKEFINTMFGAKKEMTGPGAKEGGSEAS
eukprot:TRINITY_DN199_c0_g1_i3.p1 TRINITY_DN199_c0_g1~~TRINITY_DN199_c0_g1_i3.p1  ORF type:complete len:201 (-),score=58.60 TRINITY_DN199_c0_g1_i3:57-602(-)